jgi:hypothetical protein
MTMTRSIGVMTPLVAVLLCGCVPADPAQGPAGVADLRVSPAEARAGEEVMLTLENRSDRELGYNLCPAVLDRRTDAGWEEWPEAPAEVCTMELRTLAPARSGSYRHTLPSGMPAGEYRFRTTVEAPLGEGRVDVASAPFEVVTGQ